MEDDSVLHRIEHNGRASYMSRAAVYDLENIGLVRWHHNDLTGPKIVYVYRAVTHYDKA